MAIPRVRVTVNRAAIGSLPSMPECRAVLRKCAEAALDFQQATVPVDSRALNKSLGIRENANGSVDIGSILPSINPRTKQDARKYALYVEEGHRTKSGTWVDAQPFIRPSLNAAKKGLR